MLARAEDKRVQRTKRAIREALLRLISDKPVGGLTTTELCREAQVNRNTFYAHYATPEDVLAEVEDELLAELASMLEEEDDSGSVTFAMCRAIARDPDRWRAVWRSNERLLDRALELCRNLTLSRWEEHGKVDLMEGELFLRFITVGASGVVGSWLDGDGDMPPEQLSDLINRFIFEGQQALFE